MSSLLRLAVNTQIAATGLVDRTVARIGDHEKGQSSAEYAGIIVVAVTMVGLLIAAATKWGGSITGLIDGQIAKLGKP